MAPSSCTDNAYDLAEVSTDDIVIGSTLSGPLGTLSFSTDEFPTMNDIIKDALREVNVQQSLPWDLTTDGIGVNFPVLRVKNDTIHASSDPINMTTEEMKQIDSIMLNSGTLSLTLDIDNFTANDDSSDLKLTITLPEGSRIKGENTNIHSFGKRTFQAIQGGINTFFLEIECLAPGDSGRISCEVITHFAEGANVTVQDAPVFRVSAELQDVDCEVAYGVCEVSVLLENVFNDDIINLFFDDKIYLTGSVTNDLPFNFWLTMIIADEDENWLITEGFPYPYPAPHPYPVEVAIPAGVFLPEIPFFTIDTDEEVEKMKRAKHIILKVVSEKVRWEEGQGVKFVLRFEKEGGLTIDNL
jgi:hypothetical protein